MRKYTTDNPKFQESIDIVEETDPGHADNLTPSLKQLLQNSLVLKNGDNETGFSSGDEGNPDSWSDIDIIESRESPKTLFGKLSTAVKNVRWLYKLLGTTDISGLGEGKAKGTVTGAISKLNTDLVDRVYPVGSIYISVISTDPGELFGGTWEVWGTGCVPVGVDESGTNFNIAEKTGGSASISYTPGGSISGTAISIDQMPQHNHSVDVTTAETDISHTHDISGLTGSASSNGAHTHSVTQTFTRTGASGTNKAIIAASATETTTNGTANVNGAHGHSVTINNSKTQGGGGKHKHTISGSTKSTGGSKEHSHNFEGIEATISTLQPYITCYMWKRTA